MQLVHEQKEEMTKRRRSCERVWSSVESMGSSRQGNRQDLLLIEERNVIMKEDGSPERVSVEIGVGVKDYQSSCQRKCHQKSGRMVKKEAVD